MGILKTVLEENAERFQETVGVLNGKQLADFYLSCLKLEGESLTSLTVAELLDRLSPGLVAQIVNELNDDTLPVPQPKIPMSYESPGRELPPTKKDNTRGNNNRTTQEYYLPERKRK